MRRIWLIVAVLSMVGSAAASGAQAAATPAGHGALETGYDWTRYDHDTAGSGFTTDPGISAANASTLAPQAGWPLRSAGGSIISAQPIVADGFIYWGSWDGVEHATPVSGSPGGWATSLGTLSYPSSVCGNFGTHGVADAGAFEPSLTVNGVTGPVLYVAGGGNDSVGGGWAQMYALNALSGAVLWQTHIAPSPDHYLWSSPVFYQPTGQIDPSIYEGVSDVGEPCPLVRGEIVQLDALTGAVQNTFYTAPVNCLGGSVWGSLTVDTGTNAVFAVTGNGSTCNVPREEYGYAIVKLDATSLSLLDSWKIPKNQRISEDDDFGTVPILFTGTVNGHIEPLVGAANKDGIFYIWNRNDLAAGPVYELSIAGPKAADIAPAAFDGTTLYIGTTGTTVNGSKVAGSVVAYNTAALPAVSWITVLNGPVLGSVTAAPGIVVADAGKATYVLNSSTGAIIDKLKTVSVAGKQAPLWAAPVIANGVLYAADKNGYLYAYSPGGL